MATPGASLVCGPHHRGLAGDDNLTEGEGGGHRGGVTETAELSHPNAKRCEREDAVSKQAQRVKEGRCPGFEAASGADLSEGRGGRKVWVGGPPQPLTLW